MFYRRTTQAAEKFTNLLWTRSSGSTKKKQQQKFLESQSTMPIVRRPASHAGGLARPLLGPTPHSSASMGPLPGRSRHACVHLGTPAATPPAPLVCCCPFSLHTLCSNVGYQLRVQACGRTTKPQLVGAHSALCSAVPQNQACQLSPDPSPKDGAESWCPCVWPAEMDFLHTSVRCFLVLILAMKVIGVHSYSNSEDDVPENCTYQMN